MKLQAAQARGRPRQFIVDRHGSREKAPPSRFAAQQRDELAPFHSITSSAAAQMLDHRRNIERYCRLLATELTDLERQYLHKRIAEEHAQLERLERSLGPQRSVVLEV
jgi:hypothetical protein